MQWNVVCLPLFGCTLHVYIHCIPLLEQPSFVLLSIQTIQPAVIGFTYLASFSPTAKHSYFMVEGLSIQSNALELPFLWALFILECAVCIVCKTRSDEEIQKPHISTCSLSFSSWYGIILVDNKLPNKATTKCVEVTSLLIDHGLCAINEFTILIPRIMQKCHLHVIHFQ